MTRNMIIGIWLTAFLHPVIFPCVLHTAKEMEKWWDKKGAYLPHRGRARTSHRHCEKKHTPEKNSVERRNKWQSTEA